jgi:hypothetical protein
MLEGLRGGIGMPELFLMLVVALLGAGWRRIWK